MLRSTLCSTLWYSQTNPARVTNCAARRARGGSSERRGGERVKENMVSGCLRVGGSKISEDDKSLDHQLRHRPSLRYEQRAARPPALPIPTHRTERQSRR
mmetsp:Transcript_16448/g.47241  ORF Transcript_16448/g.47241 Transcript_16448/m.47241 type:complete len:100 (-) Transcript_16448:193-492(-)